MSARADIVASLQFAGAASLLIIAVAPFYWPEPFARPQIAWLCFLLAGLFLLAGILGRAIGQRINGGAREVEIARLLRDADARLAMPRRNRQGDSIGASPSLPAVQLVVIACVCLAALVAAGFTAPPATIDWIWRIPVALALSEAIYLAMRAEGWMLKAELEALALDWSEQPRTIAVPPQPAAPPGRPGMPEGLAARVVELREQLWRHGYRSIVTAGRPTVQVREAPLATPLLLGINLLDEAGVSLVDPVRPTAPLPLRRGAAHVLRLVAAASTDMPRLLGPWPLGLATDAAGLRVSLGTIMSDLPLQFARDDAGRLFAELPFRLPDREIPDLPPLVVTLSVAGETRQRFEIPVGLTEAAASPAAAER